MILGHEKNESVLAKAITSNHVFPTWIFSGAYGIGKASIAYKFTGCLLSGHMPTNDKLDILNNDSTMKMIQNRTHPDFTVLEQTSESVSIDEIRNIFDKIYMTPTISKWRVIILENASSFNKNICNSLLKILEEPPQNTVIILICTTLGNLPKTLLSRAMKLHFSPLPIDIVENYLQSKNISNAKELASLSNGSIGLALKLNEKNGIETYHHLLNGFEKKDVQSAIKFVKDNDVDFEIVRECFLHIFHEYLCEIIKNNDPLCNDIELAKIQKIVSLLDHSNTYMLDKNAVIAATYEQFFND